MSSVTSVERIKAAEQGAVRDRCVSFPSQCVDGHALLPAREVSFPRAFFRMPGKTPRDYLNAP
jgi:hypothetical protein